MEETIIDEYQIKEVKQGKITVASLERLKIQLRTESNRESKLITSNLPSIVQSFNQVLEEDEADDPDEPDKRRLSPGVYQVLVNLVAQSDENRDFFTTDSNEVHSFWKLTRSLLDTGDDTLHWLILIFLGQFIVESSKVGEYMSFLHHEGIHKSVYSLVDDDKNGAFDVAYELVKAHADNLNDDDITLISTIKSKFENYFHQEEDTEIVEKVVEIVAYSGPDKDVFDKILSRLSQVEDTALARKMLVAASLVFTNKPADIPFDHLSSPNPYVFAVCCIAVGNSIDSDTTRDSAYALVDAEFGIERLLETFFKRFKISDVIQIQAIHMLSNLMDEKISNEIILQYMDELIALDQIVIDNSQYYQEISALYFKFVKKLLVSTTERVPIAFIKQTNGFDSTIPDFIGAKYILLQKLNFDTEAANDETLQLIKSTVAQVNQSDILEQIKTTSIINQHLTSQRISLEPESVAQVYLQPLQEILKQLHNSQVSVTQDANSWQAKAFKNNLKYMAATTTKVLESNSSGVSPSDFDEIERICTQILTAE